MTIKEYIRAPRAPFPESATAAVGATLLRLASKGQSSAHHIVAEAQKATSPLHPYFTWNDTEAASLQREQEARQLAEALLVRVVSATGEERVLRAFHAIRVDVASKPSRQKHYLPIEVVKAEPAYAEQVIEEAWKQLRSWRDRWDAYRDEFGPIFPAIEEMLVENEVAA